MARLRIRIELNRGGVGVPLQKLASVVSEAQKFFRMVGDDIHIDQTTGEWLGFDFDHESLNFTAEFVGPVTIEQVSAFNAAFDGTTSLRRDTIAQFARITEAIEEDELIGFGLFLTEAGAEPGEWRCLSRRDALRITDEIRLLIGANEGIAPQSYLPAVSDSTMGARLFSERRERALEPAKWAVLVRDIEANLSKRIGKVENEVEGHSAHIEDLRAKSASSEASIGRLVSAVEVFCEQATRRLETLPPTPLPAALAEPVAKAAAVPLPKSAPPPAPNVVPTLVPAQSQSRFTTPISLAVGAAIILLGALLWSYRSDDTPQTQAAAPVQETPPKHVSSVPEKPAPPKPGVEEHAAVTAPAAANPSAALPSVTKSSVTTSAAVKPVVAKLAVEKSGVANPVATNAPPAAQVGATSHIDIEASEPTWVSITEAGGNTLMSRMLEPKDVRSLDLTKDAVLRAGNAAGLNIRFNGKPIGSIGPHGGIREVQFKDGTYRIGMPGK